MRKIWIRGVIFTVSAALLAGGWSAPPKYNIISLAGMEEAAPLSGAPDFSEESHPRISAASEESGLSIPQTFAVTRPTEPVTTYYDSYFITGVSNPNFPVYFEGEEIQRLGTMGVFGVFVELEEGRNTFTLRQGDSRVTVSVTREEEPDVVPISAMRQDSLVPRYMSGVSAGGTLQVGCTAPAGAVVTAAFEGQTVTLKPAGTAEEGVPVNYTGAISVGNDYDRDKTQAVGKVLYEMKYQDEISEAESNGLVYVAGQDSRIAVEVTNPVAFVYPDINNLGQFKETIKAGARDSVISETNGFFELASGGFVQKEHLQILEGEVSLDSHLEHVGSQFDHKGEIYRFSGADHSLYDTEIQDNTLTLTLYNASGTPKPDLVGSRLIESVSAKADAEQGSVTYRMALKGSVWGYDVALEDGALTLALRYKPKLSSAGSPLKGVTVVVDPGHGGDDPGALGVAGTIGPAEKDVNLHNALTIRDYLKAQGASVVMTRETDVKLSLDERILMTLEADADFFISVHHNSIGENRDSNQISGMEVYYHTDQSKPFGDRAMAGLATWLDRNNRSVKQSYYRVTMLPCAPSLLLELGFMTNPLEYEKAITPAEMEKVGLAVAEGVKKALE